MQFCFHCFVCQICSEKVTVTPNLMYAQSIMYSTHIHIRVHTHPQHTQSTAKKHGIVGWVQNTTRGTVVGVAQGIAENVAMM